LLNALFNSPNAFSGFQAEIQEVNSLDPNANPPDTFTPGAGNDNTALDANFAAVAALDPTVTFKTLTPFTDNDYAPNAFGSNGDALQEIGITLYPVLVPTTTTSTTGIPEPASLLIWAGIAAGLGIYRRGRRSRVTKTSSP